AAGPAGDPAGDEGCRRLARRAGNHLIGERSMINSPDMSQHLAIDAQGLNKLQRAARDNSPESVKAVAEQFEALFLNMMLKSMREAGGGEGGLFDNEQSKMYTSMLDQQLSQSL